MSELVKEIERKFMKQAVPDFRPGDTVSVAVRIVEGDKERIQNFGGVVISRNSGGMSENFTVRRVSFGVGMERIFMIHSPRVESIKVLRQGRVRRAKLFYLRDLSGRKARIADTRRKRGAKDRMISLLKAEGALDESQVEQTEAVPTQEAPPTTPEETTPAAE